MTVDKKVRGAHEVGKGDPGESEGLISMISEWIETSIDEIKADDKSAIAIGPFGSRMKSDCYVASGIPVIRGTNLTGGRSFEGGFVYITSEKADELTSCNVRGGDLVFPHRGAIGEVGIVPSDKRYVMSTSMMKLTCDRNKAEPLFLFYFFKSRNGRHELLKNSSQVGTPGIGQPLSSLKAIRLILPPLSEQRSIAHILGTLDDKIELNRKMNQTLEAMARAIFKSWFVDFDPVRAKAEGRDPGLPPDVTALFPDSFEDSEVGEIPKGWRVGIVLDEFNLTMGQSPPGETYNETGDGLAFFQGRTDFGFRFPNRRVYCSAPTRYAEKGDTLISVRAPVGDINMAAEKCCIGRGVAAARHKSVSRSYTFYFMNSIDETFARFEAEGTVFGSISKKDFHNIQCLIPPVEVITEFERMVLPLDEQIDINEQQSDTLTALRDTLLPKLLSGEIKVKAAEEHLS